jgi:membrane protein implicated in regulation of membrane protease activity
MQYFLDNHDHLWFLIAGLSFVVELSIMGLSGPLFFFAIASLITGILVSMGFVGSWQTELLSVGLLTALITFILWKPLKKFQNERTTTDNSSDMIGLKLPVSVEITKSEGSVRYSGINWNARLADSSDQHNIPVDSQCEIVAILGNTMLVKPA